MTPQDGYIAYIVNPKSGAGIGRRVIDRFRDYLCDKGFEVEMDYTNSLEHAGELTLGHCGNDNCAMIAAAGGDGTVREIATVIAHSGYDKSLMIIPSGTENLLANELGFGRSTKKMIEAFEGGNYRRLDLGRMDGRMFASIAGFGWDGDVVDLVCKKRKGHITHLNYFWPIFKTFWGHKFPLMKVEADGEEIFRDKGLVFVGNISRYAIGLAVVRDAKYDDGLLDVCVFKCQSRWKLLVHALRTVFKKHVESNQVVYCKAREISISGDESEVKSELDGDPGPILPVDISIEPSAVKVLVPPDSRPLGMRTRIWRLFGTG
jgi:YegS/Rv2252/BmrU family lipid kinase